MSREFSSQENNPHVANNFANGCSLSDNFDAHRVKWSGLFDQMDKALSEEEKQLEIWLHQVKGMQLQCEKGLHQFHSHPALASQRPGTSETDHRVEDRLFKSFPYNNQNQVSGDQRAAIVVTKDINGIDQIMLRNPRGASVRVSLHGGQVLSWKTERGEELLFTSSKAIYKPPSAVRGGISICFPQFGNRGTLEQHGFARNRIWAIDDCPPPLHPNDSSGKIFIDLLLKPSQEDMKVWHHSFEFRLRVSLAADGFLSLISRIRNVNCKPFSFSFAYHTYFAVSDISEVRVEGLETLDYLDNLLQRERFTEQGDTLTFESEIDRVYLSSSNVIAVFDHEKKRTYVLRKEGLPDVVVWNPWEKKYKSMIDFGDEEYKHMLCVDGAAIERPITLKPGEEWTGRLELSVLPSS